MNTFRSVLFALPLVVAAALTGCASDASGEDTADATGAASATGPITLQNYVSHPKIKAVRDAVAAIEAMRLTKATNPGCDGSNDKYTDASGKIRKLVTSGGEGGFEGGHTIYYSEAGMPIFLFHKEADLTGEKVKNVDNAWVSEWRVYFDANGKTLFEAVREAELASIDVPVTTPDRLPADGEIVENASAYADAEDWFKSTGCGQPEGGE